MSALEAARELRRRRMADARDIVAAAVMGLSARGELSVTAEQALKVAELAVAAMADCGVVR